MLRLRGQLALRHQISATLSVGPDRGHRGNKQRRGSRDTHLRHGLLLLVLLRSEFSMTLIAVTGASLHLQLRSPQVASDQKFAPAMPITLIVAADNFLTRHHVFLRKNVLMR